MKSVIGNAAIAMALMSVTPVLASATELTCFGSYFLSETKVESLQVSGAMVGTSTLKSTVNLRTSDGRLSISAKAAQYTDGTVGMRLVVAENAIDRSQAIDSETSKIVLHYGPNKTQPGNLNITCEVR